MGFIIGMLHLQHAHGDIAAVVGYTFQIGQQIRPDKAGCDAALFLLQAEDVLGEERRGIRMVYATDTRPAPAIVRFAHDADLLITEGMYGDPEKKENALKHKHMMMSEAAEIAKEANVHELWLTHYSPSVHDPEEYAEATRSIFANTVISKDGQYTDLAFRE